MITKHHDAIENHMDHGLPGRLSRTQAAVAFAPEWPVDSDIRPGPTMPEHWRSSNYRGMGRGAGRLLSPRSGGSSCRHGPAPSGLWLRGKPQHPSPEKMEHDRTAGEPKSAQAQPEP